MRKVDKMKLLATHQMGYISDAQLKQVLGIENDVMNEAVMEYAKREIIRKKAELDRAKKVASSFDTFEILKPYFDGLTTEHFYIMLVNRANRVIKIEKISEGGVSGTVVDPKMVFYHALMNKASGLILAHNHPSQNCRPSESDLKLTQRLKEGGNLLEISILDHIIFAGNNHYSFADEGKI